MIIKAYFKHPDFAHAMVIFRLSFFMLSALEMYLVAEIG